MSDSSKISRRDFLNQGVKLISAAGSVSAFSELAHASSRGEEAYVRKHGFSILQGLTTNNLTQITIDVPKDMPIHVQLVDTTDGSVLEPTTYDTTMVSWSDWRVDFYEFFGLSVGRTYLFLVRDQKGLVLDERELSAVDLNIRNPRIVLASCMLDLHLGRFAMWSTLEKTQPDYMFFLGDNVYGDVAGFIHGPRLLWHRYFETRRRLPFYRFRRLIPTLATWDDHDYGKNDAGGSYRYKENSLAAFNAFFPQREVRGIFERGLGVSSMFEAFGHRFLFLDNRYYRDLFDGGYRNFWGPDQVAWVEDKVETNKPLWLMQGSQFFGGSTKGRQSFERGYQDEFDHVMGVIGRRSSPSLLLSGDIHFTEILEGEHSRLRHPIHELTSSSMHSYQPLTRPKNSRRKYGVFDENFLTVDFVDTSYTTAYEVDSVSRRERINFSTHLVFY